MWPEWQVSGQSWTDWGLSGVLKKGPAAPLGRDSPQVCRGAGRQSRVPSKVRVSVLGHVSTLKASEPAALPLGVPSVVDGDPPVALPWSCQHCSPETQPRGRGSSGTRQPVVPVPLGSFPLSPGEHLPWFP